MIISSSSFKQLIPTALKDYIRQKLGVASQEKSFMNLKELGFSPKVVLDIGAYEGFWALNFRKIFRNSTILMIEGQSSKEPILKRICSKEGFDYRIALLGATDSEVNFNIYDTASSVLEENNETSARVERRSLNRLDNIVEHTAFNSPDLIKLDTQGYELEILKGGENTLKNAHMILMEVSMIDIYKDVPLVDEVLRYMNDRNFVLYDICSLMKRPLDGALYQSDFLFVKQDSFLRKNKRWI